MEFFFWWLDVHHKMCGSLSECKAKTLIIKTERRLVVPTSVILYISHFVKSFSIYLCPAHRVPSYLSLDALIVSSRSNRNGEGERENQRRSKEAGPKRRTFILHLPHPPSAGYMSHRGAFFSRNLLPADAAHQQAARCYYHLTPCIMCFLAFLACYLNTWKLSTQSGSMMAAPQRANDHKDSFQSKENKKLSPGNYRTQTCRLHRLDMK